MSQIPKLDSIVPRNILVIDDNEDAAETLCMVLSVLGHRTSYATNGSEGILRAKSFRPDVIFLDIGMPLMDGFAVARALREDPETRTVKLVALTAWRDSETQQRASEAGFDVHIAKPAPLSTIRELLRTA